MQILLLLVSVLMVILTGLGGWTLVQTVQIGRAVVSIQATMAAEAKAEANSAVEIGRRLQKAEDELDLLETRLNECQTKACCLNPPDPSKPPHLF